MRIIRFVYLMISLLLGVVFLIAPVGWTQPKPGTKAPVITNTFAVEKGPYGYIWKIYLEAEDPDGDMVKIASVVDQPGYGRYSTAWVILKPQYRHQLKGYIQWNTYSSMASYLSEWTQITLKVSIIDKAGNESNEVSFPFTFESGVKKPYQYKLPSPFDQGDLPKLGNVNIDLFAPTLMGDGDKDQ